MEHVMRYPLFALIRALLSCLLVTVPGPAFAKGTFRTPEPCLRVCFKGRNPVVIFPRGSRDENENP